MTSVFEWCCTNKTYCYCNDSNTARVFPNSFLKYSIFENQYYSTLLLPVCYFGGNPVFNELSFLFQEINGITAALAEELFHKGLLPL